MTVRGAARRLVVVPAVVLALVAAGCGGEDGPPDVAATVAGTDIRSDRVERLTTQWVESESSQAIAAEKNAPVERKAATKLVLGFVIRSQFLEHLAAQMGIEDNPSALEAVAPGEVPAAEFEAAGWSQADFEQSLRDARISKAIGGKVFPKVAVSEVELRQKYDRSAEFFNQTWQSQIRMAYFDAEAPARSLGERAVVGDAFDTAALELGARQAGSLGVVSPVTPLPAPVLEAIAGLQTGQASDPIPGGGGFMVLVADSREDRAAMTFDQAKPELTRVLEDEARQKLFFEWFNKQLRDAEVDVSGYYGTWDPASQLVT
ncbi:MAG: peptidyl-prolyl cis-trans isomerase [Acidimicrobiia bacterium]